MSEAKTFLNQHLPADFTPVVNTVFFDMGGTLAGLNPSYRDVYHRVFQKAGYDLSLDDVESAIGYSWGIVADQDETTAYANTLEGTRQWQREVEDRVMDRLNIHPDVREDVFWQIIEAFEDPASYWLYPDALPTLDRLKDAGYKMAIISNWSWHLPDLCDSLGITPYFEQIFTSARLGYAKPHPEIYQRALAGMQVEKPQTAVHIGDSYRADVLGAGRAGIQTLWLVRPEDFPLYEDGLAERQAPGATKVIKGLSEVVDYLGLR